MLHLARASPWKHLLQLMVNLKYRSNEKELLDADDISFADIQICMRELNRVNTLLGGHAVTLSGIKDFRPESNELHICEIGCGGGDNLNAISKHLRAPNINLSFIGIDIKKECVDFAARQYPEIYAQWVAKDYSKVDFGSNKPDVIFSSLFCHHFTDDELVGMIQWMRLNSKMGFFINDLQRHPVAYHLIKNLTKVFSKSYLVKNDAAVSVSRGFTKKEWEDIFLKAGIKNYTIKWKWAFRYLIICKNDS